ncbi:hypothetical protein TNCV_3828401 [Trichonephila clavipes]|nr:hypothetical protein TNCV_3828401 [Trichonephila clavipes]
MTLRRRISRYEQLAEFERGSIIELKTVRFSFHDIVERLSSNVPTVSGQFVSSGPRNTYLKKIMAQPCTGHHLQRKSPYSPQGCGTS